MLKERKERREVKESQTKDERIGKREKENRGSDKKGRERLTISTRTEE